MVRALSIAVVSFVGLATSVPASAQTIQVGLLECSGGPSVGYVIGSSASLSCVFSPSTRRGREGYAGALNRIGLDVGYTGGTAVAWLVFAPSRNLPRGALAGSYGGVSANASVGYGGGANVLVGGVDNSITLQPVSVQGQTGLNVAAAVSGLELRATAPVVSRSKKKMKRTRS